MFVFFVRIEELFNMIVEFPDSLPALNDLKVTHTYSKWKMGSVVWNPYQNPVGKKDILYAEMFDRTAVSNKIEKKVIFTLRALNTKKIFCYNKKV